MSTHSKREISFYKGIDPGVTLSLFHSHCIVSGTSSVSSNSKTTDSKTFDSMVVLTEEARIELPTVDGEPTANQREYLGKFTAANNNISRCFFGSFGEGGGRVCYCQGPNVVGPWTSLEKKYHI